MLKAFNIPDSLILVVKKLYSKAAFSFLVNEHMSNKVSQIRGVCQGDALSYYFFILATSPLMHRANQSENIKGFSCLKSNKKQNCLAYTDDLLFFLRDNSSVSQLLILLAEF